MDTQTTALIIASLERIENKVDDVTTKLNDYSRDCSTERAEFALKIQTLEQVAADSKAIKNETRVRIYSIIEKIVLWAIGIYLFGKDVLAR